MGVLTVYVRAPSDCLLDGGGGVWKLLEDTGICERGVRWHEPEVGRPH